MRPDPDDRSWSATTLTSCRRRPEAPECQAQMPMGMCKLTLRTSLGGDLAQRNAVR